MNSADKAGPRPAFFLPKTLFYRHLPTLDFSLQVSLERPTLDLTP